MILPMENTTNTAAMDELKRLAAIAESIPNASVRHDALESLREYARFRRWATARGFKPDTDTTEAVGEAMEQYLDEKFGPAKDKRGNVMGRTAQRGAA